MSGNIFSRIWAWIRNTLGFDDTVAPPPPPRPQTSTNHSGTASQRWTVQYSPGMVDFANTFTFPAQDGIHYVVKSAPKLGLDQVITFRYRIDNPTNAQFKAHNDTSDKPPHVCLYMQRRGDTLTAEEPYKRWFSTFMQNTLTPGEHTLSVPIVDAFWISVFGLNGADPQVPAGAFKDCIENLQAWGFVFGANFAGHGLYVPEGIVKFTVLEFSVRPDLSYAP